MNDRATFSATAEPVEQTPLDRYLRIIELVAAFPAGIGIAQLTEISGLPKTTVHRLLRGLSRAGAAQTTSTGLYCVGPRILQIIRVLCAGATDDWIQDVTQPLLRELAEDTGLACFLAKFEELKVRSVALIAPDNPARGYVVPGRTLALHAASASKAILAFNDPAFVRGILPFPLPALTSHTITDVESLMEELRVVQKTGLAVCNAEDYEGFAGLACPVPLPGVGVIFSVGLTGTLGMLTSPDRPSYEAKLKMFAPRLGAAIQTRALQARP